MTTTSIPSTNVSLISASRYDAFNSTTISNEVSHYLNAERYATALKTVDPDGTKKYGVMNATLREYFTEAVQNSYNLAEKGTWARAYVVYNIVQDENFKLAFKDLDDFGATLGYGKASISKMVTAVKIREYLLFNNVSDYAYTTGQLEPLMKDFNRCKKLKLSFAAWLIDTGINSNMSVNEIRDAVRTYNNKISGNTDTKKSKTKNDLNAEFGKQVTENDIQNSEPVTVPNESDFNCAAEHDKLNKALKLLTDSTKNMSVTWNKTKGKDKVQTVNITVEATQDIFAVLIKHGIITLD